MAESPAIMVHETIIRPTRERVVSFLEAPTGWVVDAQGRTGALPHWIRPITPITRAVGPALTVRTRGRDNLAPYVALNFAKPGDVLVIQTDAYAEASVLGDILLGMAKNAGIIAVVTDGMVRDIDGLNAVGIPLFAQGLSPNSPHKDGPGEIGGRICLGNVAITSGDLIITDRDGVVVVAQERIPAVATELSSIAAKEKKMDAAVRGGAHFPDWVKEFVQSDRIGWMR